MDCNFEKQLFKIQNQLIQHRLSSAVNTISAFTGIKSTYNIRLN